MVQVFDSQCSMVMKVGNWITRLASSNNSNTIQYCIACTRNNVSRYDYVGSLATFDWLSKDRPNS